MDKSGVNKAGLEAHDKHHGTQIKTRQCKYLNNLVEQDHRAINRRIDPMLGFKTFCSAVIVLVGIEMIHMMRKGQLKTNGRSASQA